MDVIRNTTRNCNTYMLFKYVSRNYNTYISEVILFFCNFKIKMNISVKIKNLDEKNERYDLSLKTYKESITGTFNKEDLRYLIEKIDNAIV